MVSSQSYSGWGITLRAFHLVKYHCFISFHIKFFSHGSDDATCTHEHSGSLISKRRVNQLCGASSVPLMLSLSISPLIIFHD